jgi:hypothetical protein
MSLEFKMNVKKYQPTLAMSVILALLTSIACGQDQNQPEPRENRTSNDRPQQQNQDSQPDAEMKSKKEDKKPFTVSVADKAIEFTAHGSWKQVPPKSGMIEAEIKIPGKTEKDEAGRLTIMGAGGSIEDNIIRWEKQFVDENDLQGEAQTEVKTIAGHEVHFVDIEGTYLDSPAGPFAGGPTIKREHYRMLAAIIQTRKFGNYFVKFYGPRSLVEENEAHFKSMIQTLKVDGSAGKIDGN